MDKARKKMITHRFGKILSELRASKELSLRQLAATADMEHKHIEQLEKGEVNPTLTTIIALADALQIGPCELLPE